MLGFKVSIMIVLSNFIISSCSSIKRHPSAINKQDTSSSLDIFLHEARDSSTNTEKLMSITEKMASEQSTNSYPYKSSQIFMAILKNQNVNADIMQSLLRQISITNTAIPRTSNILIEFYKNRIKYPSGVQDLLLIDILRTIGQSAVKIENAVDVLLYISNSLSNNEGISGYGLTAITRSKHEIDNVSQFYKAIIAKKVYPMRLEEHISSIFSTTREIQEIEGILSKANEVNNSLLKASNYSDDVDDHGYTIIVGILKYEWKIHNTFSLIKEILRSKRSQNEKRLLFYAVEEFVKKDKIQLSSSEHREILDIAKKNLIH